MPEGRVFLDTSFAIALSSSSDRYHPQALSLSDQFEREGTILVTTRAVVLEIGNALAKLQHRRAAVELLQSLEEDPSIRIHPFAEDLYKRAFELYRKRMDKEWGMTDCISFQVMQEQGIKEALTTDEHFQQAGFHALLRETT